MESQAMPLDELTILYIIIAFLFGLLIKTFLPNYVKKKAENLATKEDIECITKKIESVRADFEINSAAHKSYVSERKDSLVKFYDEISVFHYELMAVNFGDLPMDAGKSLFEYQQRFYKSVADTLKSYQRLVIYLPEHSQLLKTANEITINVIESRRILKENFGDIKLTAFEEEEAYKNKIGSDREPYLQAIKAADEVSSKYWGHMRPLTESFRSLYQTYLTELNLYLRESDINAEQKN